MLEIAEEAWQSAVQGGVGKFSAHGRMKLRWCRAAKEIEKMIYSVVAGCL